MSTQTVEQRLAAAQAKGDLDEIQTVLLEAKAAGADPVQIDQALAEVEAAKQGKATSPPAAGADAAAPIGCSEKPGPGCGLDEQDAANRRAAADAHKKRGNERLKDGTKSGAREALEAYTDGVKVASDDATLNAQLHNNRAHVRMLLRQFVEAVDDCRKAIEYDPKMLKAYWRGAKASMHLELCRNGVEFCDMGLAQDPKDADLLKLRDVCAEKLALTQKRRAEQAASMPRGEFNADEAMGVQEQVNNLTEQVETLKSVIGNKQRELARTRLTRENLDGLPEGAGTFVSVGRAFMKQDCSVIDKELENEIDELKVEIPKLEKGLEALAARKEGAEKELKEMIAAFRRQSEQAAGGGD